MSTNVHSNITFYKTNYSPLRAIFGTNSRNLLLYDTVKTNIKDYKLLIKYSNSISIYNTVRPLAKFDIIFTEAPGFVEIKNENVLISKGIILDLQSLEYLAVVVYPDKFKNVITKRNVNDYNCYRTKCLELFMSSKIFENQKLIKKLSPYISELKTTILFHEELNDLFVNEEH